jgi:IclR family acetate operon transcriptional repressor
MRQQVSVSENGRSVGTLARGLDVLGLFGPAVPELTQKDICDALGLPMPTVHRLVGILASRGYLVRDEGTRRFRLGLEVARLMPALLAGLRLPDLARDRLRALAQRCGEAVNLAVLDGADVVYLVSEPGSKLLTSQVPMGLRLPAHCTALGKCLLAQLPPERAREALGAEPYERLTPHTLATWVQLETAVERVRAQGISISEEEYEIGLISLAVPVVWVDDAVPAAINVSLPTSRATTQVRAELAAGLRDAAAEIAAAAGAPGR